MTTVWRNTYLCRVYDDSIFLRLLRVRFVDNFGEFMRHDGERWDKIWM